MHDQSNQPDPKQQPDWVLALIDSLPPDQREAFEERAAIMQFDGRLGREHAEVLALLDVLRQVSGVQAIRAEIDGGTNWMVTTDLLYARQYLQDIHAVEIGVVELAEVIHEQYGGLAMLNTVG